MSGHVLSVDGGGSKTIAILVNREGHVVSHAKGGGVNPLDQENWRAEADRIFDALGPSLSTVEFGCVGAPGYGEMPSVTALQEAYFKHRIPGHAIVENDVRVAFDGAFLDRPGVLLLVGTGSMVWASDGVQHQRVGGWGEIYSDEGSGYWIGREALSLVTRHLDGRTHAPALSAAFLRHFSADAAHANEQLFAWAHGSQHRRSAIASLAKLVSDQAEAGDSVARSLLDTACHLLAEHVVAAKKLVGAEVPWAMTGGIGKSLYVQFRLKELLGVPNDVHLPPVGGGAWRAARAAGWEPDQTWIRQLRVSLAEHVVHS